LVVAALAVMARARRRVTVAKVLIAPAESVD
jgi:hypothetical protein